MKQKQNPLKQITNNKDFDVCLSFITKWDKEKKQQ